MAGFWKALSERIAGATDALRFGQRAPEGRIVLADASLDSFRQYVSDNLNPGRLKQLLRAADSGQLNDTLALFEEMESKDGHLRGVVNKRRSAVTGLDWQIISEADASDSPGDQQRADAAAAFVERTLNRLDCFDEALEHLATAIGPNVAVLELVWRRNALVDLIPIASHRLRTDPQRPGVVMVTTAERPQGIVATTPKFVVHIPDARPGFPFSMTLCHAHAYLYLIKLCAATDWASYVETFGQPVRWATWPQNATEDQKKSILDMLKNMGSHAYAAFSTGVQLQLVESSQRGTSPHKDLVEWAARQQSIAWLGGNLTTDNTGATGSLASATVQQDVAQDLLEDDVKREGRTVRRQILAPMVAFQFGSDLLGERTIVPTFKREFREEVDRLKEAQIIGAAMQAGMPVPEKWALERVGIPEAEPDEAVLTPPFDAFTSGVNEGAPIGP